MKSISKILKSKYLYYLISIFLIVLLMLFDLKVKLNNLEVYTHKYYYIYLILAFIVSIITIGLILIKNKKNIRIEKVFCILALVLGLMYLVASPLFTGSDEHNHYYRIYEITEGKLITPVKNKNTVGGMMPKSLVDTFENNSKIIANRNIYIKYNDEDEMMNKKISKKKVQYGTKYSNEYANTALYSPIQYFPQLVGFFIGKLFKLGPFWLGELGRLFNLLFYVLICTYFLYKLPRLKLFASLVLLSPTLLSNATTLSADAFTNALIFGFITMIIYNRYNNKLLTIKDKILFIFLSIMLAACKIVYLPFILFLLVLPKECFKSKKEKIIFILTCVVIGSIIGLGWIHITDRYFDAYYLNTETQKMHILKNIIGYFVVVLRTYSESFSNLLFNVFGGNNLYHSQLPVYNLLSVIYIVIVVLAFFKNEENKKYNTTKLTILENVFIIILMLAMLALITTAIYIQCTANFIMIDAPTIHGLQGRYYIPFVLCVLLLGSKSKLKLNIKNNQVLTDVCILCNMFVIMQMVVCFMI